MNLQNFEELSAKERAEFSRICNLLMSSTYILREDAEKRISREYSFVNRNFELFEDYLSLSGWEIYQDNQYGIIYVKNVDGYNRVELNKLTTVMLIVLRILYEEKRREAGLTNDVIVSIGELFGKIVNEYSVYPKKPPQKEIKESFRILEHHHIIRKISDNYEDFESRIQVLPSVLIVVSDERCKAICDILKTEEKEAIYEETDTAIID